MKSLTLQIDKVCFQAILNGRQTIEHRFIYPSNANRYVNQTELEDGSVDVTPVEYDELYLINGRRKDAPRLRVEVLESIFVVLTDDEDKDLTFVENGEEYLVCQVWYHLGKVTEHTGADHLLEDSQMRISIETAERKLGITRRWEDEVDQDGYAIQTTPDNMEELAAGWHESKR